MTASSWILAPNGDAATTTADLTKQKQLIREADRLLERLEKLEDTQSGHVRQQLKRLSYKAWQRSARRFNAVGMLLESLESQASAELVPPCPTCGGEGGEDCATANPMVSVFVTCNLCDGSGEDYTGAALGRAA